jgi:integrase
LKVDQLVNKKVQVKGKWVVEKQIVDGKSVPVKVVVFKNKVWNDNQFNHYRAYLRILYTKIKKQEVIDYNPIDNIDIIDTTPEDPDQQQRKVLTQEQRRQIHAYTIEKFPEFNRLIHIFFHSGTRRKEIMKVQGKQVDLAGQRFKALVKKRKKWIWVWKTIKDVALPYWIEAMENCGPEDYVFSVGLKPGPTSIRPEQVTRRWRRHIKNALDVESRFYDLKHLHTTEVIDLITEEIEKEAVREAANHNSHTSEAMVIKIYDVKQVQRKHNKVKKAANSFV